MIFIPLVLGVFLLSYSIAIIWYIEDSWLPYIMSFILFIFWIYFIICPFINKDIYPNENKSDWNKYINANKDKVDDLFKYIQSVVDKSKKDSEALKRKYYGKNNLSSLDLYIKDLRNSESYLSKIPKDKIILIEILTKDIEHTKSLIVNLQSIDWKDAKDDAWFIHAADEINQSVDSLKSILKKHRVKLIDKTRFSYWEYYQYALKYANFHKKIIATWIDIDTYIKSIPGILASSDDLKIYRKIKLKISKLFDDYLNLCNESYIFEREFNKYNKDFWKFHTK